MPEHLKEQKTRKKQSIMRSAYECFMEKGIHKTSIDEIVRKAEVAKGTFYLYFKDKNDLMEQISMDLSKGIILDAYQKVKAAPRESYTENVIALIDNIIEYFKSHKLVLKLIERNLSWPRMQNELSSLQDDQAMNEIVDALYASPSASGQTKEEMYNYLFSIVALCGTVGYSSIILGQPDSIDNMKLVLYDMIRKILQ